MELLKRFFTKTKRILLICLVPYVLCLVPCVAASNIPGDIGDFGMWATPQNQAKITQSMWNDLSEFQSPFQENFSVIDNQIILKKDFVPFEARIGRVVIAAMSQIGRVIDISLAGFISVLIVALFAFWIMMETYQVIKDAGDVKKLGLEIVRKGLWITVWFILLASEPAKLFMWIMGPIISAGSYMSDLILGAVTAEVGVKLPDTCAAIHKYMTAHPIKGAPIDPRYAADLLCVPTRLAGFFYTCLFAGFEWMKHGIGNSALTFVAGLAFVVIFAFNIWKFALQAIGVIASMFWVVITLPFTALIECFDGSTSYKGPIANFFKMFAGVFKAAKLENQFMAFINAVIYFVVLSIIAAIGLALLSPVVSADLAKAPTVESDSFIMVLITGLLVAYLVSKADTWAKNLGGAIEDSFGKTLEGDIKHFLKKTTGKAGDIWKVLRKK